MEKLQQFLPNTPKPKALVVVQTTDDVFLLCFREENETDFTVYATQMKVHRYNGKAFQYVMNEYGDHIFIDNKVQKRIRLF